MTRVKSVFLKRHNEDDHIDEVRIVVRERYKTSGLSGDEWRFHRVIEFYRKGVALHEEVFNGDMQAVVAFVPLVMARFLDNGLDNHMEHLCFQPGCREPATSEYELIEEFGRRGETLATEDALSPYHSARRRFCQKHLRRGDCAREDCDANYRVISGYGPDGADMSEANVTEARRVDVTLNSLDELPDKLDQIRRNQ